jgi:tetratricopeptide (TPR) repeat protein/SAM-dependent methyltransferase
MADAPQSPNELLETALKAQKAGHIDKAANAYIAVLEQQPTNADAWHYLGLCQRSQKQWQSAIDSLNKSIEINPDNASALNSLGATLCAVGRFEEAEEYLGKAIGRPNGSVEAYRNLGLIYFVRKEFEKALEQFRNGLSFDSEHLELLKSAGNALLHLGQPQKALLLFEKALSVNARDADLQTDTGIAYQMEGRFKEALEFNSLSISIEPGENRHWAAFCACVNGLAPEGSDGIEDKLIKLMRDEAIAPHDLMMPIAGTLFHQPVFREIIGRYGRFDKNHEIASSGVLRDIEELARIPLFIELISEYPVTNLLIEKLLTTLRKCLLLDQTMIGQVAPEFLPALAMQCFNTDYSFAITDGEETCLQKLIGKIYGQTAKGEAVTFSEAALVGCYEPLANHLDTGAFTDSKVPPYADKMLRRLLLEPHEESQIRVSIPDWTSSAGDISDAVRSQYEESPYPRWTHTITTNKQRPVSTCLQSPPLNMDLAGYKEPKAPEILVAGCGTGQHAIQPATRFANAKVTAIDLSKSSLAYAKRKTSELGITNIDFGRADILKLDELGRSFDIIESVGVLHHLENPMAGWQILNKLLRPGGLMKIGLYSELARSDVIEGRKNAANHGYSPSAKNMRQCRQTIIQEAIKGNKALLQLSRRSDFFSLSAFRDLVFHVQEHRFDLVMIKDHLEELGLKFLDFEMPFAGELLQYRDSIANRTPQERLSLWHEYEQQRPDTFRGMYQFWCLKPAEK